MPNIKIPQFEGPMELLLELIVAEKLEISQIALAKVTDQYLAAIPDIGAVSSGELADFLVIASTLLLIKSRSLLPRLAVSQEEEQEMASLEDRLREYRRYRSAGKILKALADRDAQIFTRSLWQGFSGGFFLPEHPPSAEDLAWRLRRLIQELVALTRPKETKIIARVISVEEKIKEILRRIDESARLTIEELAGSRSRAELVLAFLALLFLFHKKTIMLSQGAGFGKIEVRRAKDESQSSG
jgi:segregation and condensation protein A